MTMPAAKATKSSRPRSAAASASPTRLERLTGVPDAEVAGIVRRLKKSSRYVSHMTIPEAQGTSAIIAVFGTK